MMKKTLFGTLGSGVFVLASVLLWADEPAGNAKKSAATPVDFAKEIQPILARSCLRCHGPSRNRGGFRLDTRQAALKGGDSGEPAILPGKGHESHLIKLISGKVADLVMPPSGKRLSASEIARIKTWIDQGANWPGSEDRADTKLSTDHWCFQPIAKIQPPPIDNEWIGNPIDPFILDKLRAAKLQPAPRADRVTLIRRLFFDMHGLPPTPKQIERFVGDQRPDAYEQLVDEVLASPRYGERWAQHWLDVVRYADTHGFETNKPRDHAWPYRDYVIAAFNSDKPYDQFILEQVAGDRVGVAPATGFLVAGPQDLVKSPDPVLTAQQRQDELNEIINATSSTFLGLTVSCARCHNHKFDPILQKDYYAMQAVFAGVRYGDRPWPGDNMDEDRIARAKKELAVLQGQLAEYEPVAFAGGATIIIDDEDRERVQVLAKPTGRGVNPSGTGRGEREDAGGIARFPNISGGSYTWWNNRPGEDLIAYQPRVEGRLGVWLSWGCGWATHATDVVYLLDRDGNPDTKDDQQVIATINQQKFGDGTGDIPSRPLWSGFAYAGEHLFHKQSCILMRGGKSGPATTADVIVLQPIGAVPQSQPNNQQGLQELALPRLRAPVNSRANIERFEPVEAQSVRFVVLGTNNDTEPCIDELEIWSCASATGPAQNVARLPGVKVRSSGDYPGNPRHKLAHINDGQYSNDRSWISNQRGKGWVQITLPAKTKIDRIVWGRDRVEKYTDRTPTQYIIAVDDGSGQLRQVATSADRVAAERMPGGATSTWIGSGTHGEGLAKLQQLQKQADALRRELQAQVKSRQVFAGNFVQPAATHRLYRGDPMAPREIVAPDILSIAGSLKMAADAPEQERRLALARWIASKENPLTARVMVNRVWHYHFGTGIVATPSDFGKNGGSPSHPKLLDWLAQRFMDDGWSLKKLHRLILLSSTYKQSAAGDPPGKAIDAGNRLLWHFPQRRLEAEVIRDSILAVSGVLDLTMGGPGFSFFKPNTNYVRVYLPKETFGPAEYRRMIYSHKVRMEPDGVFGAFDCPDAGQPAPRRNRSTTALQALSLFNSTFVLEQAKLFSQRVEKEAGSDIDNQITKAFRLALGRPPRAEELQASRPVVQSHGLPMLCRVLFNTNEFLFLP